ncbi:MAG TPA: LEA type 2 family protein [Casimicrobiaceae bacterium]|nr:LEA type 2 family protein [Casimicrobiaceae bacterium]
MERARDPVRRMRLLALVAVVLMLAACASVALRNPPQLDVTAVALDRVEGPDAYFTVDVALANRVDQPIEIDALEATLSIEGEQVAQAKLVDGPVRLPANGTANAQMTARTGMDAVLRAVAAAMRRGATLLAPGSHPVLHYTLQGSATLARGGRFPFSKSGELGERQPVNR